MWCVLQGNVVSVTESTAGGVLDQRARLITEAYGKKHLDFYYTIDTIKMTVTFDGKNINLAIVCGEGCNKWTHVMVHFFILGKYFLNTFIFINNHL